MKLYAAIDLHSNNSVVVVIDEEDRVMYQKTAAQRSGAHPGGTGVFVLRTVSGSRCRVDIQLVLAGRWADGGRLSGAPGQPGGHPAVRGREVHQRRARCALAGEAAAAEYPTGRLHLPAARARAVRDLLRRRMHLVQTRVPLTACKPNTCAAAHDASSNASSACCLRRLMRNCASLTWPQGSAPIWQWCTPSVARSPLEGVGASEAGRAVRAAAEHPRRGTNSGAGLCWKRARSGASQGWVTLPPMRAACKPSACPTTRRRARQQQVRQQIPFVGVREAAHFAVRYNAHIKRFYQRKAPAMRSCNQGGGP